MADENNGKNGKVGLVDRVKEDIQACLEYAAAVIAHEDVFSLTSK